MSYTEVLFTEQEGKAGTVGLMTLNRPEVLNALNHDMVMAIYQQLQRWEKADHIKAVIIKAAPGRAFCAGGDLRLTYDRALAHDPKMTEFFVDEYRLNRTIFHYPKPYIAFLDGITMGGGVGLSIHGSHRIATDRLLFAMPETGIGFFPDVGGTYFLPRLPWHSGFYLGLTGARIASDACVELGLAQYKFKSDAFPDFIAALTDKPLGSNPKQAVTDIAKLFEVKIISSPLLEHMNLINNCFSKQTMEEIIQALKSSNDAFCSEALTAIAKKSPTSLKVTLQALQRGANMNFDACMDQELVLTSRFLQGHDFPEGIRAVIIDKDQKPVWVPDSLDKVVVS